ncbi:MAG: hypothetical protein JKY37_01875 [Nannocystaceae bacterium]|nr:hypothetical protein [Nannocystaceae bacterium]
MRRGDIALIACLAGACAKTEPYACQANAECTLLGVQGTCTPDLHCAYPDTDCESGYRYPAGVVGGLAGECAQGLPAAGATGGSTPADTVASSGAIDTTDTTGLPAGSSSSSGFGDDSTSSEFSDCDVVLELEIIADTFLLSGGTCTQGPCSGINFGASPQRDLAVSDPSESAFVMRVADLDAVLALRTVDSVELFISLTSEGGGTILTSGLDPAFPWVEGVGMGEAALDGEATWASWGHNVGLWPNGGPPEARLVEFDGHLLRRGLGDVAIDLDVASLMSLVEVGGDSLLLQLVENEAGVPVIAEAREGRTPPQIIVLGCR